MSISINEYSNYFTFEARRKNRQAFINFGALGERTGLGVHKSK